MTLRTTRRRLLAGAAAGAALPAAATARSAPPAAATQPRSRPRALRRARALAASSDGSRLVVAHERRRTVEILEPGSDRASVVDVGGHPVDVAVSPDGRHAAVTTGFWAGPGLALVDLAEGAVRVRLDVGPAPGAVAFGPGGELLVAGGEQAGELRVVDVDARRVVGRHAVGRVPRAIAPAGPDAVWVALDAEDRVVLVDLASGRVSRAAAVRRPSRLALSPGGGELLVVTGGRAATSVVEIATASGIARSLEAGRLPSAVAWTSRGEPLVALAGEAAVVVAGTARRAAVGAAPRALAVAGERAWSVSGLTAQVSEVRL